MCVHIMCEHMCVCVCVCLGELGPLQESSSSLCIQCYSGGRGIQLGDVSVGVEERDILWSHSAILHFHCVASLLLHCCGRSSLLLWTQVEGGGAAWGRGRWGSMGEREVGQHGGEGGGAAWGRGRWGSMG